MASTLTSQSAGRWWQAIGTRHPPGPSITIQALGTDRLGFEVTGAGPESLADDFSRFRFLLGAAGSEGVFTSDGQ
jgi:hypothetical protein